MNVIITGSNRGIGKAIVEAFAGAGCNIWACARKATPEYEAWLDKTALKNQQGVLQISVILLVFYKNNIVIPSSIRFIHLLNRVNMIPYTFAKRNPYTLLVAKSLLLCRI